MGDWLPRIINFAIIVGCWCSSCGNGPGHVQEPHRRDREGMESPRPPANALSQRSPRWSESREMDAETRTMIAMRRSREKDKQA